jgi:hypothetical protein
MDKITDLSVYSANKKIKRGEKNTNSYLAKKTYTCDEYAAGCLRLYPNKPQE